MKIAESGFSKEKFLEDIEQKAPHFSFHTIRVPGKNKENLGLVLIDIGICYEINTMTDSKALIEMACAGLNKAKAEGKNRICHVTHATREESCHVTVEEKADLFTLFAS